MIFFLILINEIIPVLNYITTVIFLTISSFSSIFSLIGRKSKRVKDYIILNQELQLDRIVDIEINDGSVSKRLHNAICNDLTRKKFLKMKETNKK